MFILALKRRRRAVFISLSIAAFATYQLKKLGIHFAPKRLKRQYRKWVPNYAGHDIFSQYLKYVPQNRHMFIFESFFGKSASGSPKYLFKELKKRYPKYTSVWVYNSRPHKIPGCKIQVKRGSDEYFFFLAILHSDL